jgi:Protein of unknown function (DUF2752)
VSALNQELSNSTLLSRNQRLKRWTMLGLCSAPIIGSFFYRYGYRLPFFGCPLRSLTGIPCPTCGMTHSFVAIAQGDFNAAIKYHLFGPAIFLLFLAILLLVLWDLRTNINKSFLYRKFLANSKIYLSVGLSYLGYYTIRIVHLASSGELSRAFLISPIGTWLNQTHFHIS